MKRIRVIPVLLLHKRGLCKTVRFRSPVYLGDPINAVKIFNDKEVDELLVLDIDATRLCRPPAMPELTELAGEALMPMAYGGGITTVEQVRELVYSGFEKVVLGAAAFEAPGLISEAAGRVGSQSVVACIDVKANWLGKPRAWVRNGTVNTGLHPVEYARRLEQSGAGELILQSIDRDGTFLGYQIDLIKEVANAVNIPVVACGGASSLNDFAIAAHAGASAVAAGSMFVYNGSTRGILLSYPTPAQMHGQVFEKLS